jgi:hypothetical protein
VREVWMEVESAPKCPLVGEAKPSLTSPRADRPRRRKGDTMDVRREGIAALVVGVVALGLLSCGDSGRQQASQGAKSVGTTAVAASADDLKEALRAATRAARESATRAARRREAFATFGEPADRAEYASIVGELREYYGLLANARFERACSLLSRSARTGIAKFAGNSGDASQRGCARRLTAIFARTVPVRAGRPEFRVVSAKEVRLKGNEGYVVFTTTAIPAEGLALSVVREGGHWRVASPIALPLADASSTAPDVVARNGR